MEIPDVLVVTKADLGDVALRARRDLNAALRSLGRRDVRGGRRLRGPAGRRASTSWSPRSTRTASGSTSRARRLAARRAGALADFVAEHGERGLRALGGRRAALRALEGQDPGADVPALLAALEAEAGVR